MRVARQARRWSAGGDGCSPRWSFLPARNFVADARLAADGFELLLPELLDHPILGAAAVGHLREDGGRRLSLIRDGCLIQLDAGKLSCPRIALRFVALEICESPR